MGKTYRRENQYKKAREGTGYKKPDHDHERTEQRKKLRDTIDHWSADDSDFDYEDGGS